MKMKKLAALALSAVFALGALTACGGSSSSGSVPAAASASGSVSVSGASLKEVNIGLIQLMEHASLDEIRTAIEAGLEAKGAEYGVKVNVDYQNAQGDTSTINTICQQFVGNKVDAIVAIATPAAQGAAHRGGRHRYSRDLQRRDGPCRRRSCGKPGGARGKHHGYLRRDRR